MSKTDKVLLSAITLIALLILVGLIFSVSPRSEARRNRAKVVELLAKAHSAPQGASGVPRVTLGDGTELVPDRDQVIAGYIFKLHAKPTNFTIEAHPLRWGETGTVSFFRDETGVIRFDGSGHDANEKSRSWPTPF